MTPKAKTAIVGGTNTLANSDTANWIGSMILEAKVDAPDKNGYIQVAKDAAAKQTKGLPQMIGAMAA